MGSERVSISLDSLVILLLAPFKGKRYITVSQVSGVLGVSTRSAGRILSKLEKAGYVRRYSTRTYEVLFRSDRPVATMGIDHRSPMNTYLARPR